MNYYSKYTIIFTFLGVKIQKMVWILSESFNDFQLKSNRNVAAGGKMSSGCSCLMRNKLCTRKCTNTEKEPYRIKKKMLSEIAQLHYEC